MAELTERIDYDKLEPGRELDALVAEKVMGWELRKQGYLGSSYIEYWWPGLKGMELLSTEFFNPSADIAAAWEVVEKLRGMGFKYLRLVTIGENDWQFHCADKYREISYVGDKDYFANASTAPHAICIAALKAVADG